MHHAAPPGRNVDFVTWRQRLRKWNRKVWAYTNTQSSWRRDKHSIRHTFRRNFHPLSHPANIKILKSQQRTNIYINKVLTNWCLKAGYRLAWLMIGSGSTGPVNLILLQAPRIRSACMSCRSACDPTIQMGKYNIWLSQTQHNRRIF